MSEKSMLNYWGTLNVLLLINRCTIGVLHLLDRCQQAGVPRLHSWALFPWARHLLSGSLLLIGILGRLLHHLCGNWAWSSLQDYSALCNECHPPSIGRTLPLCCLSGRKLLSLWSPFWTVDMLSRMTSCRRLMQVSLPFFPGHKPLKDSLFMCPQ